MKHTTIAAALTAASLFAFGACSKDEDKKAESGGETAGKTAAAEPAALEAMAVPSMNIELDVPADTSVTDNTETAMFPSGTLYASPTIFVTGKNDMFWKADLAAQKAEIEKEPGNKFKKFTKEETLEGGFHLEYELSSMMDEKETLYGFHIRKTVGGTEVDCSSNTSSPEEMARGVAMCKSIRASK